MLDRTGRRMNLSANCIELLLSVAATTVAYLDVNLPNINRNTCVTRLDRWLYKYVE